MGFRSIRAGFFALRFRFIPIPENLNRYMLTVANLKQADTTFCRWAGGGDVLGTSSWRVASTSPPRTPNGWEPGGPWEARRGCSII